MINNFNSRANKQTKCTYRRQNQRPKVNINQAFFEKYIEENYTHRTQHNQKYKPYKLNNKKYSGEAGTTSFSHGIVIP